MDYFDYFLSDVHGFRIKELLHEKALEEKRIPTLRMETDYGMEDVGQLKTRVDVFMEVLKP